MKLFCAKEGNKYSHFFSHKRGVEMCGYEIKDIIEVKVEEDTEGKYWAYYDFKDKQFMFIWHKEGLVRMCFPDGGKSNEKNKEGKFCRVKVTECRI